MRLLGTTLMGFGIFCVSVVVASVMGPMLRSLGIDVRAETTSVIGTAMIGVLSVATGMLMRRRVAERETLGRAVLGERDVLPHERAQELQAQLPPAPAEPLRQSTPGRHAPREERR